MLNGIISHKIPQALAKGEWTDKSQPLVDTNEFRELLVALQDYRQTSLGLIARHLHKGFQSKKILCKAFWDAHQIRTGLSGNSANLPHDARIIQPMMVKGLKWNITQAAVEAEMRRQGVSKVDFKFTLQWHYNEFTHDGPLLRDVQKAGDPNCSGNDLNSLSALVHFMVLEHLELIAEDAGMTVFGNVLKDSPQCLQEPCLVALELMKFGFLSGEPFDPAQEDRPFPEQVNYPRSAGVDPRTKAVLLLSRVMSLVPMKLRNDMWNADVDFDLAAFHSLIRVLKRALRQLVEASLGSLLLKDVSRVKVLPPGFMCSTPKKEDHLQSFSVLPTFMLPRACMGIVVRFFLDYRGDASTFQRDVQQRFPCCEQAMKDLRVAFAFWEDLRRCVDAIAEPLGAEELSNDMKQASKVLEAQQRHLKFAPQGPGGSWLER